MPAYIKAYVWVMLLSLVALPFLKRVVTPDIISTADFQRRAKLWLLITSVAFLSGNFWIYAVLCFIVTAIASRSESNRLALFVALIFAVPPMIRYIPGIGPFDYLLPLNHEHLLNYAILCPLAVTLFKSRHLRPRRSRTPDVLVGAYILYQIACSAYQEPAQGTIRFAITLLTDIGVVYYVASRSLTSLQAYREVIAAFVVGVGIVALVALFETTKSWWVYDTLQVPFGFRGGGYHTRGNLNLLRAEASLGHPIVLGYALGVALMLAQAFTWLVASARLRIMLHGLLFLALLVTFSRGPWVGAVAGMLYLTVSGPRNGRRIAYAIGTTALVVGGLALTPFGRSLYTMLPFVGTADSGSIVYRQLLWNASLSTLEQNPWFGDMHYLKNPLMESMRQGEGIIDMVNTYLQIGLAYGLVGVGLFLCCAFACWRCIRIPRELDSAHANEFERLGRSLKAAQVVILATIATVSSVELVPIIIWVTFGLCAGFAGLALPADGNRPTSRVVPNTT